MRLITILMIALALGGARALAQGSQANKTYLSQTPPSDEPEVFAPGLISLDSEYEFGSVFNRAATEFFYAVEAPGGAEVRYTRLVGDSWTTPVTLFSGEGYGINDPFLSPDEQRLYVISQKPTTRDSSDRDYDICYFRREAGGWSDAINAGPDINTPGNEYYISFSEGGTLYFASNGWGSGKHNFDIYAATPNGDGFNKPVNLGQSINTRYYEADVFVAPDESYLIFCSRRPAGLGRGDLYISFKNSDGQWTPAMNMGDQVNTAGHELCPFVSVDGKYLFYTSNEDIYWVSTHILDDLKRGAKVH